MADVGVEVAGAVLYPQVSAAAFRLIASMIWRRVAGSEDCACATVPHAAKAVTTTASTAARGERKFASARGPVCAVEAEREGAGLIMGRE